MAKRQKQTSRKRAAADVADAPTDAPTSTTAPAVASPPRKRMRTNGAAVVVADPPMKKQSRNPFEKKSAKPKKPAAAIVTPVFDPTALDTWGWKPVPIPEGALLSGADDMSGFMTLEEISGVDVVTEGTDRDGKILSFKAAASFKPAARKPTNVNAPMSGAEMQALGFVHVDDVLPDDHPADIKRLTREAQAAEAAAASDDDNGDDEADGRDEEPSLSTDDEAADGDEEWASASESDDDAGQEEADKVEQPTSATTAESVERPTVDSPEDLPDMSAWTDALPMLHPWLLKGLADQGFTSPTPIQAEAVPLVLARGKNIVGAAETGSGKTLAFGLPILQHIASSHMTHVSPVALILSPTRELALQIVDHLRAVIKPFSYTHRLNRVNIVPLVGGFSEEKQRRMVSSNPHILVATPGRLWDLIESGQLPAQAIQSIRFLVLDEADKMLEKGKFKELENLVGLFNKTKSTSEWDETTMRVHRDGDASHGAGVPSAAKPVLRQTLVFSATLPTSSASYTFKGRELTLKMLLSKLQLKSYETVDVTGGTKTTSNLIESRIDCTPDDKEVVLYYLLTRYPGRTLVFVNAISTIRRLVPILTTMRVPVYPLHAQMQQRQRLRNLERFAASDDGVLIASDVASRGLDIKNIDHVIHFQVPMTSDLYVHRSGRTARGAANTGLSIVLISPKELPAYRKICKQLGRDSIPAFPIEVQYLSEFRKRINLAKKIDVIQHTEAKTAHNRSWAQQAAEALEVDLSEEEQDSDVEQRKASKTRKESDHLKAQLHDLLNRAILPRGTSKRYMDPVVAAALNKSSNAAMPAVGQSALAEMKELKRKIRGAKRRV